MSEPERWLTSTEAPGGMGEMLSAAQKVGPSAVERAALAGKLGVAASGLWIVPLLKGLAATAVVVGGVWGAAALGRSPEASPSPSAATSAPTRAVEPGESSVTDLAAESDQEQQDAPQAVEPAVVADPAPKKVAKSIADSNGKTQPTKPSEASLIGRAKGALETSPSQALTALSEHAKLYPSGVLAEEREVLRIRALKNLGRERAAEAQQEKFHREHPESVHHVP